MEHICKIMLGENVGKLLGALGHMVSILAGSLGRNNFSKICDTVRHFVDSFKAKEGRLEILMGHIF